MPPSSLRSLLPGNLTPAPRRQDHTTSPSASRALVCCTFRVHRIPPRVRDDRERPSCRAGRRINGLIWGENKRGISSHKGLDDPNHVDTSSKFSLSAQGVDGGADARPSVIPGRAKLEPGMTKRATPALRGSGANAKCLGARRDYLRIDQTMALVKIRWKRASCQTDGSWPSAV